MLYYYLINVKNNPFIYRYLPLALQEKILNYVSIYHDNSIECQLKNDCSLSAGHYAEYGYCHKIIDPDTNNTLGMRCLDEIKYSHKIPYLEWNFMVIDGINEVITYYFNIDSEDINDLNDLFICMCEIASNEQAKFGYLGEINLR